MGALLVLSLGKTFDKTMLFEALLQVVWRPRDSHMKRWDSAQGHIGNGMIARL